MEQVTLWVGEDTEYALHSCVRIEGRGPLCGKSRGNFKNQMEGGTRCPLMSSQSWKILDFMILLKVGIEPTYTSI